MASFWWETGNYTTSNTLDANAAAGRAGGGGGMTGAVIAVVAVAAVALVIAYCRLVAAGRREFEKEEKVRDEDYCGNDRH